MAETTFFAPAERAGTDEIEAQSRVVGSQQIVRELLDAQVSVAGVINRERQFVLVNEALLEALGMKDMEEVIGRRPGEALQCVHSCETPGGCGTSRHCRYCGAVGAVLECQSTGVKTTRECRLTCATEDGDVSLDLRVTAAPCTLSGEKFTVVVVNDIGDEKRRRALERVFFHDTINTATTLHVLIRLADDERSVPEEDLPVMKRLSGTLIDDLVAQRDLAAAEKGDLVVSVDLVDPSRAMREVTGQVAADKVCGGRRIEQDEMAEGLLLSTDERLVSRVLLNMLRNAVEATPEGGTVEVGVTAEGQIVRFRVSNPSAMAEEDKMRVFQRSFSTKGEGRGLGTYSMKLLGEKYLGGRITFDSSPEAGTTFYAEFPLEFQGTGAQGG